MGHPAHVHMFRHPIFELRTRGHTTKIAAVEKETIRSLLSLYGLEWVSIGRNFPNLVGKVLDFPTKDLRLLRLLASDNADLIVSTGSPYAAQASAVRGIPHIAFSDTEIAWAVLKLMLPFTDVVCTPSAFSLNLGPKHVTYPGYKELAYLHPSRFSPDPNVLNLIDAERDDCLILVRFGSWNSSHDMNERAVLETEPTELIDVVRRLQRHGRVLVTTERLLPEEIRHLVVSIPLDRMHDLISYATLYIGEGATMASESGVLGTPWIFVSRERRGYLDDQERAYGLGYSVQSWKEAIAKAEYLLAQVELKDEWGKRRAHMLREKRDVASFIVSFINDWPASFESARAARMAAPQGAAVTNYRGGP